MPTWQRVVAAEHIEQSCWSLARQIRGCNEMLADALVSREQFESLRSAAIKAFLADTL